MAMHKKFSNSPLITISQNQKICQIVLIHSLMSGKLPWTCLKCQKQFRFQIIMNLSLSKEILQKFPKQTTRGDTVEIFINTNRSWNPEIFLVKIPEKCSDCSGHKDRERIRKLLVLWCFFFQSGEVFLSVSSLSVIYYCIWVQGGRLNENWETSANRSTRPGRWSFFTE